MPAPSKNFYSILDAAIAAGKPITTELLTQIRDSLIHMEEWLGKDYTAATNHNHDGVNSAELEVGGNSVRNGSFEAGTTSWTTTAYTGGTVATNTANDLDGATALAFTSTVLANGGGEAVSVPINCTGGLGYVIAAVMKASAANISTALKVQWLDDAKNLISESTVFSTTTTPTSFGMPIADLMTAPNNARFYKVKFIGGVPASGSGTGTVYLDGVFAAPIAASATLGTRNRYIYSTLIQSSTLVNTELHNIYVPVGGVYTVKFDLGTTVISAVIGQGRIYVNGVATGTIRQATGAMVTFSEEIIVPPGSTLQIFGYSHNAGNDVKIQNIKLQTGNAIQSLPSQYEIGGR